MKKERIDYIQRKSHEMRERVLDMCVKAGTGHVTSSFSCTEILTSLYQGRILNYDSTNPKWENRDRFILSKGQASPILYAVLADVGYFPIDWLDKFCQKDARFGVHLQNDVPGVEITTGSLGHGLGVAAGMALAAKMDRKNYFIFVLLGDGECYEGSVWEAAMFASHNRLNNLIAFIDRNWLCVTDFTENLIKLEPFDEKWKAFGWDVKKINGHSIEEILNSLDGFRAYRRSKPLMIIADTIKGKGIQFMENKVLWHGIAPEGEDAKRAIEELAKGKNE